MVCNRKIKRGGVQVVNLAIIIFIAICSSIRQRGSKQCYSFHLEHLFKTLPLGNNSVFFFSIDNISESPSAHHLLSFAYLYLYIDKQIIKAFLSLQASQLDQFEKACRASPHEPMVDLESSELRLLPRPFGSPVLLTDLIKSRSSQEQTQLWINVTNPDCPSSSTDLIAAK